MQGLFRYNNRHHAGQVLAGVLEEKTFINPVLLALPRGGVPVASEVADALQLPFDILNVRKIGAPFNEEYGIGAMCEDLKPLFQAGEIFPLEDLRDDVEKIVQVEKGELKRRMLLYRGSRPLPEIENRDVIIIDDGLATGVTAAAAGRFLKAKGAHKIYLAVPVGPASESELLRQNVDEIICPYRPSIFSSIGLWYKEFNQVTDAEVLSLLHRYHPDENNSLSL